MMRIPARRKALPIFTILFMGTFIAAPPLIAQVPSVQDTLVLDWNGAWTMALERNESLAIVRNNETAASQKVREAYSAAMPTVNFNGTFNHYFQVPSTILNLPAAFSSTGQPVRLKAQFGSENNVAANIQLTQPLWLAGKVGFALKAAKAYKELNSYQVKLAREDLHVQLMQTYYGAILADRGLAIAREGLKQATDHYAQVQQMHTQGVASDYDLIRAQVAVSNLKPNVSQAEAGRDLIRKALKNLLGLDVDSPIKLVDNLEEAIAPPTLDYEDASAAALHQRVELRQLDLQKSLYEIEYKVNQRSVLWPNLLAGLRWETSAQASNLRFGKYEFLGGYGGQVILQIPLFDGFASHWKAQQSKVNVRNTRLQRIQLERGIRLQVFEALRTYQRSAEELNAAKESLVQAEKGYSIAETRYQSGVGTQLETLDAQLQLNVSRVNLLQAQYDLLIARANFDRASGSSFVDTDSDRE
jgi:outer membrane protein